MTRSVSQASAIALSVVAFVSLAPLSNAFADPPAEPAPTPSAPAIVPSPAPTTTATAPSLGEPAPTPGWADAERRYERSASRRTTHYAPLRISDGASL